MQSGDHRPNRGTRPSRELPNHVACMTLQSHRNKVRHINQCQQYGRLHFFFPAVVATVVCYCLHAARGLLGDAKSLVGPLCRFPPQSCSHASQEISLHTGENPLIGQLPEGSRVKL